MTSTVTDSKRTAIAEKLADIRSFQNLLIANEQQLIGECSDSEIRDRFQKMLDDDRKNLGIVETVITAYGIQAKPKETVKEMVHQSQKMMQSSELSLYEKVGSHELLKHAQVMSGLIVHKAAQVVGADISQAITPLNAVNFENRAHQEQLKGILEVLGTRELTGQEADQGVWTRVQDAMSAMSGILGSVVTQATGQSDLKIEDVLRMDHKKVDMLFSEIEKCNDPQKIQELFAQLFQDLSVHAEAEEKTVYPKVQGFYSNTQELYDQQTEMKSALEEIKALDPVSNEFRSKMTQLKVAVTEHVQGEEGNLFVSILNHCSIEQQEQLATEFKEAKKQLQTKMS
jgi:hemerythrin superfamily protein